MQGLVPVLNTPGSASGGSLQSLVMCAWPFGGGAGLAPGHDVVLFGIVSLAADEEWVT